MKRRFIIGFLVLGSFACGNGLAVTVNLNFSGGAGEDFNGNLGAAPDNPANTFWTDQIATNGANLVASDGVTPTTIGFGLSGAVTNIGWNSSIINSGAIYERGYCNNNGGPSGELLITGLNDTNSYDVYLYSYIISGPYYNKPIYGGRFVSEGRTQFVTGFYRDLVTFERDINYAKFSGLSPSNGAIVIDLENFGMGGALPPDFHEIWCLAGFQITDQLVPEPNLPATGTVNVNFSSSNIPGGTWGENFSGNAGAAPDPGNTFWTDQFWITGRDLVASDGSTMTGIDFIISGWYNDAGTSDKTIPLKIVQRGHRTIGNRNFGSGPPGELFLSGLSPTNGYDVYIYSGLVNVGTLYAGRFVAGGATLDTTGGNFDTFERGNNYVKFSNLTPNALGELVIGLEDPPIGGFPGWCFTGFQITSELASDFDTVASTSSVFNAVFSATFDSESNTLYGLESTTDLVGGAWTPNDEVVTGNGGSMELFKSTDPDDLRSHRVIVLP